MFKQKRMIMVVLMVGVALAVKIEAGGVTRENVVKTEPAKVKIEELSRNKNNVKLIAYGYQVDPLKEGETDFDQYMFRVKVDLEPNRKLGGREWLLTNWGNEDDELPPTVRITAQVRGGEIDLDESLPQPGRYIESENKETFIFSQKVGLPETTAKVEWSQSCPPWISEIKRLTPEKVVWLASVNTNGILKNPEAEKPQVWGFSFLVKTKEGVSPKVRVDLEAGFWCDRQWPLSNEIEVVKLTTDWLRFEGRYPARVKVLGLPQTFSTSLYLDKRLTGSLSVNDSYETHFLHGSSHLFEVERYVPEEAGREGARYRCKDNSHTVRLGEELVFRYQPQYYLTILSDFGEVEGIGWYQTGKKATAKVKQKIIGDYVFDGWSKDASGKDLESKPICMDRAKTAKAEWKREIVEDKESPLFLERPAKEKEREKTTKESGTERSDIGSKTEQKSEDNTPTGKKQDEVPVWLIILGILLVCVSLD